MIQKQPRMHGCLGVCLIAGVLAFGVPADAVSQVRSSTTEETTTISPAPSPSTTSTTTRSSETVVKPAPAPAPVAKAPRKVRQSNGTVTEETTEIEETQETITPPAVANTTTTRKSSETVSPR